MQFPSLVTSQQCLECRECCSFKNCGGDWSPRLTPDDVALLEHFSSLQDWRHGESRIALQPSALGEKCFFLDEKTHHCQVYSLRPYECRLYPFLISAEKCRIRVYLHLACPAAEALLSKEDWHREISLLRNFFQQESTLNWVKKNSAYFVDYRPFSKEVKFLFDVMSWHNEEDLLSKKKDIHQKIALRPSMISAMHLSQVFVWQDFFTFDIENDEDHTLVFARQPIGVFLYWPPLGEGISSQVVEYAFDVMQQENGLVSGVSRIENVSASELIFFDERKYLHHQRGVEYIYRREDLALLKGQKYHTQRNEINHLLKHHQVQYREFQKEDQKSCLKLFEDWAKHRKEKNKETIYQTMIDENAFVHQRVFQYGSSLDLIGRVVEVDGEIKGYTWGYFLSRDVFCVFIEIVDTAIKGLGAFIFHQMMNDELLKDVEWVNTMDDFHLPDIMQTKGHWHPIEKMPVYTIYKK